MRVSRTLPWWAGLCAALCSADAAHATGTMAAGDPTPIEQRVAIAVGPSRTTLWTQVRLDASSGQIGIIVPARPGASIDWVTDAWMEALEASTAPRILPPTHLTAACPGEPEPVDPVHVAGTLAHVAPLSASHPVEVLADAWAVDAWATQHGLTLSGSMFTRLASMTGQRFIVTRFEAPDGEVLTPTLRVTGPDVANAMPFALSEAGDRTVQLTTWVISEGRAALEGGPELSLSSIAATYDAATGTTDYRELSASALQNAGASAWLTERASATAFTESLHAYRDHHIGSLADEYAARAAIYEGDVTASLCASSLTSALTSDLPVAASCARASLGVVEGMDTCVESPSTGTVDPSALRCGTVADDFAVALGELTGAATWLTRISMSIAPHAVGDDRHVTIASGSPVDPVLETTHLDTSGCGMDAGGAGGGDAAGGTGGTAGPRAPHRPRTRTGGGHELRKPRGRLRSGHRRDLCR